MFFWTRISAKCLKNICNGVIYFILVGAGLQCETLRKRELIHNYFFKDFSNSFAEPVLQTTLGVRTFLFRER